MGSREGLSMWSQILLGCAILSSVATAAKAPIGNCEEPLSPTNPKAEVLNANDTLFEDWHDQFVVNPLAPITTQLDPGLWLGSHIGNRPNKRQNCQGTGSTAKNYCFSGNTAANAYCACQNRCCTNSAKSTGWCCAATVDCDIPNASCKWITSTTSIVRTTTLYATNYFTTAVTLPGGTSTSLVVITSTSTITISSADTATVFATTTISQLRAGKRDYPASSAAASVPAQPTQTISDHSFSAKHSTQHIVDAAVPRITRAPSPWGRIDDESEDENLELRKRQAPTSTVVIGTATIYVTTIITVSSTARPSATTTSTTTSWLSTTIFLNAKATRTVMTTLNLATVTGPVPPTKSDDTTVLTDIPRKGLSTAAKAGIGAGSAAGSLLIFAILGMIWRRKKKNRDEKNQEMINSAVTAAIAAQQGQPGQHGQPTSYIANDKNVYAHTYPASPNTYGTPTGSPPPHEPHPVYPAPMHPMPYTSSEVSTPPQQYQRLSELPDQNAVSPSLQADSRPLSYGSLPVGYVQSPEMAGSPVVQRYEMPSYHETSSPHNNPAPYSGPQQYPGGPQQNYPR